MDDRATSVLIGGVCFAGAGLMVVISLESPKPLPLWLLLLAFPVGFAMSEGARAGERRFGESFQAWSLLGVGVVSATLLTVLHWGRPVSYALGVTVYGPCVLLFLMSLLEFDTLKMKRRAGQSEETTVLPGDPTSGQ